jgi:hypothetical protein
VSACSNGRSEDALRDAIVEVDGSELDGVVIVGTNLPMSRVAGAAEFWLGKPVIALNTATYWHALRGSGVQDEVQGFGRLLSGSGAFIRHNASATSGRAKLRMSSSSGAQGFRSKP